MFFRYLFLSCLVAVVSCNSGAKHLTDSDHGSHAPKDELKQVLFMDSVLNCCLQSDVSIHRSAYSQYIFIALHPDSLFIAKLDSNYSNPAVRCYLYTQNHYYASGIDRELVKDTLNVDFLQVKKSFNKIHADLPSYHVLDYGVEYSFPHVNSPERVTLYAFVPASLSEDIKNKYALILPFDN